MLSTFYNTHLERRLCGECERLRRLSRDLERSRSRRRLSRSREVERDRRLSVNNSTRHEHQCHNLLSSSQNNPIIVFRMGD